jgi:hypothetical protein
MISAELVHHIRQLLPHLQRNVWYAINITECYNPTFNAAIQLNEQDYTALMFAIGILNQWEINIVISLDHLAFFKVALQNHMTIQGPAGDIDFDKPHPTYVRSLEFYR